MSTIYALIHPETREIRYVGKTQRTTKARYSQHLYDSKKKINHLYNWWRTLEGLIPEMITLEVDPLDIDEAETRWILKGKSEGWPLTNMTPGGEGSCLGHIVTPETRAKISAANKGKPGLNLGKPVSEVTREKLRQKMLGRKHSDEAKAKMAISQKGRIVSDETRAKLSVANKGKARRGHPCSDETKAKISASNMGRPGYTGFIGRP